MEKAIKKYEGHLLNKLIEQGRLDEFTSNWDKCEAIVDYIVEWFNKNCHLETVENTDILIVRFGEKYYNKAFNFTHGVTQRVMGIVRKLNDDERLGLYLLSDTYFDKDFKLPDVTDADKEFFKAIKDNNCGDYFMFLLGHAIHGFCFGELETLLNIILDKKDKLVEVNY